MARRGPKGWVFTLGLAALAVAAGLVARASTATDGSKLDRAEVERCIEYGRLECCLRLDEAD